VLRIQASSRVLAVLGDPITHSVSPEMHNAAIAGLGLDAVYVAFRVRRADLPAVLETCRRLAIAGNLTVPLKQEAAAHLGALTPLAQALGAVNTLWADDGVLWGDNTDVAGIEETLAALGAEPPWLVCGTGGSARAVAAAAVRRGIPLRVRSRDVQRARAFCTWTRSLATALEHEPIPADPDDDRPVGTVINATPLGLAPADALPLPRARWRGAAVALDLVYRPGETAWVGACRADGLRAADGRMVLVAQGAHAFERFFPGTGAPRDLLRAAVERALTP
jgi:shikimate dehydrogenase